jgi:hypothetical protein
MRIFKTVGVLVDSIDPIAAGVSHADAKQPARATT